MRQTAAFEAMKDVWTAVAYVEVAADIMRHENAVTHAVNDNYKCPWRQL